MRVPVAKVYVTQGFGENPDSYKQFGLKGHNGVDFRAFFPNGERCFASGKSEVLAPHDGVIKENTFDKNGYGYYIKIENEREGSVIGHLARAAKKQVGEQVELGEIIGMAGSTGNSTGMHVHWGYYRRPRNRANGYDGFVDPSQWWGKDEEKEERSESMPNNSKELIAEEKMITITQKVFEELVTKATKYDELRASKE